MSTEAREEKQDRETFPLVQWVCTGYTQTTEKKPGVIFREVQADGALGEQFVYGKKRFGLARIGVVYHIEAKGSQCYPETLRYHEAWHDRTAVTEWQTREAARQGVEAAKRIAKTETTRKAMAEALAPIRKIYRTTNHQGKIALEIQLLSYLRGGNFIEGKEE